MEIIGLDDLEVGFIVLRFDVVNPDTAIVGTEGECVGIGWVRTWGEEVDFGHFLCTGEETVWLCRAGSRGGMDADLSVKAACEEVITITKGIGHCVDGIGVTLEFRDRLERRTGDGGIGFV